MIPGEECFDNVQDKFDIDDIITENEREHLLFKLHRYLAWVGEPLPDMITINGREIRLHDLIWKLIKKESLSEQERQWVKNLIRLLEGKEDFNENCLQNANLTKSQAKQLYDEAAGLLRAIMDLRDLEEGRIRKADFDEVSTRDRLQDARRWVNFVKHMNE